MDVEELLRKIPRPYGEDIPELYRELDGMTRRIAEILMASNLYNAGTQEVDFGKATSEDLVELISKDPEVMVPFFVMITADLVRLAMFSWLPISWGMSLW
ncbi:MAG: hypothetical protein RXR06_05780 [Thermoproteus sp.]